MPLRLDTVWWSSHWTLPCCPTFCYCGGTIPVITDICAVRTGTVSGYKLRRLRLVITCSCCACWYRAVLHSVRISVWYYPLLRCVVRCCCWYILRIWLRYCWAGSALLVFCSVHSDSVQMVMRYRPMVFVDSIYDYDYVVVRYYADVVIIRCICRFYVLPYLFLLLDVRFCDCFLMLVVVCYYLLGSTWLFYHVTVRLIPQFCLRLPFTCVAVTYVVRSVLPVLEFLIPLPTIATGFATLLPYLLPDLFVGWVAFTRIPPLFILSPRSLHLVGAYLTRYFVLCQMLVGDSDSTWFSPEYHLQLFYSPVQARLPNVRCLPDLILPGNLLRCSWQRSAGTTRSLPSRRLDTYLLPSFLHTCWVHLLVHYYWMHAVRYWIADCMIWNLPPTVMVAVGGYFVHRLPSVVRSTAVDYLLDFACDAVLRFFVPLILRLGDYLRLPSIRSSSLLCWWFDLPLPFCSGSALHVLQFICWFPCITFLICTFTGYSLPLPFVCILVRCSTVLTYILPLIRSTFWLILFVFYVAVRWFYHLPFYLYLLIGVTDLFCCSSRFDLFGLFGCYLIFFCDRTLISFPRVVLRYSLRGDLFDGLVCCCSVVLPVPLRYLLPHGFLTTISGVAVPITTRYSLPGIVHTCDFLLPAWVRYRSIPSYVLIAVELLLRSTRYGRTVLGGLPCYLPYWLTCSFRLSHYGGTMTYDWNLMTFPFLLTRTDLQYPVGESHTFPVILMNVDVLPVFHSAGDLTYGVLR